MGDGMQIPAHRVGGPKKLWGFEVYGLSKSWVMRVPTVLGHAGLCFARQYESLIFAKYLKAL